MYIPVVLGSTTVVSSLSSCALPVRPIYVHSRKVSLARLFCALDESSTTTKTNTINQVRRRLCRAGDGDQRLPRRLRPPVNTAAAAAAAAATQNYQNKGEGKGKGRKCVREGEQQAGGARCRCPEARAGKRDKDRETTKSKHPASSSDLPSICSLVV